MYPRTKAFQLDIGYAIKEYVKSGGVCLTLGGPNLCQARDMDLPMAEAVNQLKHLTTARERVLMIKLQRK